MTDRTIEYRDLWSIYKAAEQPRKDFILHWLDLPKTLKIMSWKTQLEILDNAPEDIVEENKKLLKPEAARKLGLETKKTKVDKVEKVKKWSYNLMT